ncbi:13201_t:CDS:10, partial [Acaulospora colombiana]
MYSPHLTSDSSKDLNTKVSTSILDEDKGDFTINDQEVDDEPLEEDSVFCLPRNHVPHAYLDLSRTEMASMDEHLPETNIGYKLLMKMGWKAGQGLGSSQQGRREPIRIDTKSDSLGVGKLEEENYYHATSTAKRKALDSEKIAEETEEERLKRQSKVQKRESIKKELEIINAAFYCELCDKQYTKITEYEAHLSSYDHNHRKRFKEMKESSRPSTKLYKKREKERKREEKELARMQQAALQRATKQSSPGEFLISETTSTSTKILDGRTNNGGWATVIEAGTSSVSTVLAGKTQDATITSGTRGWISTNTPEKKRLDNGNCSTSKVAESMELNNRDQTSPITSSRGTKNETHETDNKNSFVNNSESKSKSIAFGISKSREQSDVTEGPEQVQDDVKKEETIEENSSLYSRMFADRGPNKRKIKLRDIAEQMIEDADPCDSDYQYVQQESSDIDESTDTDDTIVSDKQPDGAEHITQIDTNSIQPGLQDDNIKEYLKKWVRTDILFVANMDFITKTISLYSHQKLDDPGVCCICLEGSTTEENMLVYCDGDDCEVVCHQECYGIVHLPASDEPWYCDRCLAKPSETVKTGAFRRMKEGDAAGTWVHVVCALWMPGMWIGKTIEMSEITIENIDQKNWNRAEKAANEGATVHCDAGECKSWLHVTCAQSLNLLECLEDDPEISDPYFVYCPQHGSHGPARLNEWEKWCRKRDRFYESVRNVESHARTERVKREPDVGASLCELFEDSYAQYRQRREEKIAKQRRKLAQINSSIQGLKEQSEKSESNVADYTNKIDNATKENIALEGYLQKAHEALVILTRSMVNIPNLQLTNPGVEGQNICSSTMSFNKAAVSSLISTLESTKEIEWTQQTKECARKIYVSQLDTSCMQNLGIKAIQKILMQMAKEQKSRRTARRGKKRSAIGNSSRAIVKRSKNIINIDEPPTDNGDASKKNTRRAPKRARQRSSQNVQTPTQEILESASKTTTRRGRRPKSKVVVENRVEKDDTSKVEEEVVDVVDDSPKCDENSAVSDNRVENGACTDDTELAATNRIVDAVRDDSTNGNGAGDITVNNIINDSVADSMNCNRELNDRKEEPSNNSTNNMGIAKLLNPVENTISTLKSRNNVNSDDNYVNSLTNNVYTPNNNLAEGSSTGSSSINISLHNNFINHSVNSHLNVAGNEGTSSIYPNNDLGIGNSYLLSGAHGMINSTTQTNGNSTSTSMAIGSSAPTIPFSSSLSPYRGLINSSVTSIISSSSTAAKIAYATQPRTPNSTHLFTATPTPAGFYTTTPVDPEMLAETKSRKRKNVESENSGELQDGESEKRRKPGKRKSKKNSGQQTERVESQPETVEPSPERPPIPQPVCAVCRLIEPPPTDRPSATYIYPSKARESMLLKGRDKVHRMIRCNFCTKWYHLACMNPPRRTMPTGGYVWRCEECDPGDSSDPLAQLAKSKDSAVSDGNNQLQAESPASTQRPSEKSLPGSLTRKWRL